MLLFSNMITLNFHKSKDLWSLFYPSDSYTYLSNNSIPDSSNFFIDEAIFQYFSPEGPINISYASTSTVCIMIADTSFLDISKLTNSGGGYFIYDAKSVVSIRNCFINTSIQVGTEYLSTIVGNAFSSRVHSENQSLNYLIQSTISQCGSIYSNDLYLLKYGQIISKETNISDCTVYRNAGGVNEIDNNSTNIIYNTYSRNTVGDFGRLLYIAYSNKTVKYCSFIQNEIDAGGLIFVQYGANVEVILCSFYKNYAKVFIGLGTDISNYCTLINCSVVDNVWKTALTYTERINTSFIGHDKFNVFPNVYTPGLCIWDNMNFYSIREKSCKFQSIGFRFSYLFVFILM